MNNPVTSDRVQRRRSVLLLAMVVIMMLIGQQHVLGATIDPYAFFVGRVSRDFGVDHRSAAGVHGIDLSPYIDREARRIRSMTGELMWDYGLGIATVNTPTSQGATGVLNALQEISLDDVIIRSDNSFGTVIVVSLDGEPIASTRRLLIQAMTEDQPYGFTAKPVPGGPPGQLEIVDLGHGLLNVRNIESTVVIKSDTEGLKAFSMDVNGYDLREIAGERREDGFHIPLPADRIYTLVVRGDDQAAIAAGEESDTKSDLVYVWWEAEDAVSTNFPRRSAFSPSTFRDTAHLLSGGDWLSVDSFPTGLTVVPRAEYVIEVPEDGEYAFYVRKFWLHGPFRWRFNDDEWHYLGRDVTLLDEAPLRQHVVANWVAMGTVTLTKGTHRFEFELTPEEGSATFVAGMDAFLLTKSPFVPSGNRRPGEKLGLAEAGWWPFEPDSDRFRPTPIDLRYLNEEIAGQSGFVRKEGDWLVRGDGEAIRFWGINVGTDVINLERTDIDYLARKLAKYGVNIVRIHGRIFDERGEISPDSLEKYHYFVHALKRQGIYVTLSYYFVLWWEGQPFGLLQFDERQQELYRRGVRKLLRSPNPFEGGLPLAEDPAVAMIEIQNEDSYLFWTFNTANFSEDVKRTLYREYGRWLTSKYGSLEAAYASWGPLGRQWDDHPDEGLMEIEGIPPMPWATGNDGDSKRRRDSLRWMVESQLSFYESMVSFLRDDIGSQSLIVASNWITADPQKLEALERYTYSVADVVDRHAYFESAHEAKDGMFWTLQAGDRYTPRPAVLDPGLNPVKIVHNDGQASMISEITWTHPTPYGAEGPFFLSVYGALQGIDVLHVFSVQGPHWAKAWEKWPVMSPTMMGQFPAFALMYRRGDVAQAPIVLSESVSLESLLNLEGSAIYESLNLDDARK